MAALRSVRLQGAFSLACRSWLRCPAVPKVTCSQFRCAVSVEVARLPFPKGADSAQDEAQMHLGLPLATLGVHVPPSACRAATGLAHKVSRNSLITQIHHVCLAPE